LHLQETIPVATPAARFGGGARNRKPVIRSSSMAAWFSPDLALTVAMVSVVYLIFLFSGPTALFRDSDAGWHIRSGERILASGTLPHTDTFSFSKAGETWIAWEWLADVAVATSHRAAGLGGVAFF
jgi:hypothetical protein